MTRPEESAAAVGGADVRLTEALTAAVNEWSRPKSSAEYGGDLVRDFLLPVVADLLAAAVASQRAELDEARAQVADLWALADRCASEATPLDLGDLYAVLDGYEPRAEVCEHGFRPEPGRCPAGCTTATHTRYGKPIDAPAAAQPERECRHTELPDTMWSRLRNAETDAGHRLELLKAVLSFVDANDADLPLTLLEQLRRELTR